MNTSEEDELEAGTGFMPQMRYGISKFENLGYIENLIAKYDHFECRSGQVKLFPNEFQVDKFMRFENTSDPDDQSILYAISSNDGKIKGTFIESYGLYHEDLSPEILEKFKHMNH